MAEAAGGLQLQSNWFAARDVYVHGFGVRARNFRQLRAQMGVCDLWKRSGIRRRGAEWSEQLARTARGALASCARRCALLSHQPQPHINLICIKLHGMNINFAGNQIALETAALNRSIGKILIARETRFWFHLFSFKDPFENWIGSCLNHDQKC